MFFIRISIHDHAILIYLLKYKEYSMPSGVPITSITRLNSTVKDLLTHLYALSALDIDVLFILMKSKEPMTTEELAKKMKRDKSNIFRSVQKLVNQGLCSKENKTLEGGGYFYVYRGIDVKTFKMETERKIKDLQEGFERILKKLEDDLGQILSTLKH